MITSDLAASNWPTALLNHLWQSTAVALLAWLLAIALRNNSARVRYAVWFIASLKFLLPFQMLTYLGARWSLPATSSGAQFYTVIEEFTRPLRQSPIQNAPALNPQSSLHAASFVWALVGLAWFCGFAVLLAKWFSGWRSAMSMTKAAIPIIDGRAFDALVRARDNADIQTPIRLLKSEAGIEPGIFGIVHPVLLWPSGLSERLDDRQIEAIMAHELEHVRRRDNLTSAIHVFVEAVFWFHPLVRWISARLSEERERACDERVVEQNAQPEAYAESILKVCAFCIEPSAACVSGVSGADLKQRILRIMMRRSGTALGMGWRFLLVSAGILLIAAPIGFGVLHGQEAGSAGSDQAKGNSVPADLPKYEVATVKPTTAVDNRFRLIMTPDGVSLEGVPIQLLLQQAFGVENDRIFGAPGWVESKRYSIEAKVSPEDAPKLDKLKMDQRNAMMLPLLQERFGLKFHHESRELPTYALVIAKGGSKLKESSVPVAFPSGTPGAPAGPASTGGPGAPGGPPRDPVGNRGMIRMSPGGIEAQGGSTDFLSHALSRIVGRTVVNKTGLAGNYDFSLNWTPEEGIQRDPAGRLEGGPARADAPVDASGPTIFTALEEQLGLKLQAEKGKVDVIVIDHIDLPTEN